MISPAAHIDIHPVPPTGRLPSEEYIAGQSHFTFVTSGMSSLPMSAPPACEECRYAELMVCLPGDWPGLRMDGTFDAAAMADERNWWPIRCLKMLARLPHVYNSWLWHGHTVPNGDPCVPYAENTKLCCMLVLTAALVPPTARTLLINDDVTVHFFALWPLYKEEMDFKLEKGLSPLIDRIVEAGMTEMINPNRPNLCK